MCSGTVKAKTKPGAGPESSGEQDSQSCQRNKEWEAPIAAPRHRLLPHFPDLCLKQSSAIVFLFGLGGVWGLSFATHERKSNSLLVLHFELALLQVYIVKPFLFPSTSWASLSHTCWIRIYGVCPEGPQDHNIGLLWVLTATENPPSCFLKHMVITRSFWTWRGVVSLLRISLQ